jgi:hypothetical protein
MADERDDQTTQVGHQVVPEESGAVAAGAGEGEAAEQTEVFFSRDAAQEQRAAPTPPPPAEQERSPESPAEADRMAADEEDPFGEKPHLYALGAFAGAFVFAQILKRITGGGDDD